MLKAVLDTNQFVSALIAKGGASAQLLQAWREGRFILITSREIIHEIERVLHYPHLKTKYKLSDQDIDSTLQLIESEAVVLAETPPVDMVKEDPDDNKFLSCAHEAEADYLVSGDSDLLKVGAYKAIAIVTVRDFLSIMEKNP